MYMVAQQRHGEGTDLAMQAFRLNPLSKVLSNEVAYAYYYAGDFEKALPFSHRAVELDADFVMGYALIGMIETELGHWDEALAAIRNAMRLSQHASFTTALLAYTSARMGEQAHARELLNASRRTGSDTCFPSMNMAAAHAAVGERDAALECLRRARRERDVQMMSLASDPRFNPVRSTPEFQEIVSSIKLA
jgi:tetratricopeptide (TPR) repeat protein